MQDTEMTAEEDFDWGEHASTFGDRLARAREYTGMDQAQLARRLGVKLSTIKNWEFDRSEPRANRLQMLSGLLNVSMMWLMNGDGVGVPEDEPPVPSDVAELLAELRDLRLAQTKLAERSGRIEKRLRALYSES